MKITHVWKENFNHIKTQICEAIKKYNYVAMDTEFPGIVTHPTFRSIEVFDFPYKILKSNVDLLNLIQIGFTFSTKEGLVPQETGCWQFNFYFSLKKELFAQDSIDLLLRSGVDFQAHEEKGLGLDDFAGFLLTSGLVLNKKIKWISFHSGYDFGYLIKILTNKNLPSNRDEFLVLLNLYFPCVFDIKYISHFLQKFYGGLNKLAEKLEVPRFGRMHQAGSDSLLTLGVFFRLKKSFMQISFERKFGGILYGLGSSSEKTNTKIYPILEKNRI